MKHIRVLGLGSPAGDDQLGWRVTAELERSSFVAEHIGSIDVLALDRSQATLLQHLADAERVILVDAIVADAPHGTLVECHEVEQLESQPQSWGLAASLQLAAALEQLPPRWTLLACVIDPGHTGALLSEPVFAAVPLLVRRIEDLLQASLPQPA